ncbi:MAG: hypothetical protein M3Q73_04040 [bacterium]|nr:hypothetical protein [bacterium]
MQEPLHKGFALIEIVIASAIVLTGVLALSEAFSQYVSFALTHEKNIQAAYLAEESLEAVTHIRDRNWVANIQSLSNGMPYYLSWTSNQWQLTSTPVAYVDQVFLRSIIFTPVYRNASDQISSSGSTLDTQTKYITVSISYRDGAATTTKTMSTYISNINGD